MKSVSQTMDEALAGSPDPEASDTEADRKKELLQAVWCCGSLTVAGVALRTSLSVKQASTTLSALADEGRLEVRVERGRPLYSLREERA